MSDEARDRIRRTIYTVFDRWGQRSMETFMQKFQRGGAAASEAYRVEWIEQAFLERRAKHPGLARYVLKQTLKSKVLRKHRTTLLRSALTSIAAEDSPAVKELVGKLVDGPRDPRQVSSPPAYTRRTLQRLRKEEYPEVFFDHGPADNDGRLEKVSTIFGPFSLPRQEATEDAAAYLSSDRAKVLSDPTFGEQISHRGSIRDAEPEYLEALREFRTDCDRLIGQLLGRPKMSKETLRLLHEEFQAYPELIQVLFNHILSILAVKWFRGRREADKARLLEDEFQLHYTKKDALRAHVLIAKTFGPKVATVFLTNMASFAMHVLGLPEDGMHIHEAILELHTGETAAQAAAWDNIGICLRDLGEYTKAMKAMEKATPLYRQLGDTYHEFIAERNIGEALIRIGRTEDGFACFERVQARILELKDGEKRVGVWLNLATGARRCGLFDLEYDSLMKAIEEDPDTDLLVAVQSRLLELNLRLPKQENATGMPPPDEGSQSG